MDGHSPARLSRAAWRNKQQAQGFGDLMDTARRVAALRLTLIPQPRAPFDALHYNTHSRQFVAEYVRPGFSSHVLADADLASQKVRLALTAPSSA